MGRARGYNAGGGQSSLGYLLGGGEMSNKEQNPQDQKEKSENVNNDKPNTLPVDTQIAAGIDGGNLTNNPDTLPANPRIAAGVHGADLTNNYHRADGQNRGNFITDRPSTRVHYSPGGCSSLGYLFGGSDGGGGN